MKEFEFQKQGNGYNIFWIRTFPDNHVGYERIYLGNAFKVGYKWSTYHAYPSPSFSTRMDVAQHLKTHKIANNLKCPHCDRMATVVGVEYAYTMPDRYDGVSEWNCTHCETRWGRWSGRILKGEETEPVYGERRR